MSGPAKPAGAPPPPLPPTLLIGASARCLLDEMLERRLAPLKGDAEIERLPAAAYAKEKKEKEGGGLVAAVLARLGNTSLFGARRVLVVLGGQELLRDKQAKAWIEKPTPRTHLVIAFTRAAKDGLYAVPAGLPVETQWEPGPQSPAELRRFLERRLKERGASATPAALELLLEQAGASLDALDAELEKLALYRLGATIDAVHVGELCGHTAGRDFDRLWQALRERRLGDALGMVEAMASEGLLLFGGGRLYGARAVANTLLPMLLARVRRVAAVAAPNERLVAAVGDALKMKPGYVHFLQQDARALGPRLARWQGAAVAAEVKQKRIGLASEEEILEGLFVEFTRAS